MKKLLLIFLILSMVISLVGCPKKDDGNGKTNEPVKTPSYSFINDVNLENFAIVYSASDLDYAKRAAEYIKAEISARTGLDLPLITDGEAERANEIVVGNTNRAISESLDAETGDLQFAILAEGGDIALEADYFVIAAAAYYFIETYVPSDDYKANVPSEARVLDPIVKEAKNYIVLIGDGMGVYQTKMFDYMENNYDFSDGEDLFYGYLLPYQGYSRTDSLSGTTDSAAGGTALSSGRKTYNEYIGRGPDGEDVKLITELAISLGMKAGVMSTETQTGATPASFSAHAEDRNSSSAIRESQTSLQTQLGLVLKCGFTTPKVIDSYISETISKIENENGFFLMYEEAFIDKKCHNNDLDGTFEAVVRFNQAIGFVMEYAFYNPDTFVLITADHETGGLAPDENGVLTYSTGEHTSADVPVFAYGYGAELFDGQTVENIQIPMTIASFMDVYDFGDQSVFSYLGKE